MPDPTIALALLALVALAEASPYVRLPIGLLLAIAMLAADAELLPVAVIGAAGVMLARLSLALAARRGRDRLAAASPAAKARRDAMQRHLTGSPAYARMTFLLAALPGVPAGFLFPLLGAMHAPLWPALAGTLVGRTPVLALTAAIFAWLGRLGDGTDSDAALALGIFAVLVLAFRTVSLVDWAYRSETGRVRLREPDDKATQMAAMFGSGFRAEAQASFTDDDPSVVEGELLGEEVDDDDDSPSDDEPPMALPPTGLAPS